MGLDERVLYLGGNECCDLSLWHFAEFTQVGPCIGFVMSLRL